LLVSNPQRWIRDQGVSTPATQTTTHSHDIRKRTPG
jgi:hypothetical protein